jgi:hypothetical protein
MMPKNKIGRHMLSKLKLYSGPAHEHQAQSPIPLEAIKGRPSASGAIYSPKPTPAAPEPRRKPETAPVVVAPASDEPQLPPPASAHESQLPPPAGAHEAQLPSPDEAPATEPPAE